MNNLYSIIGKIHIHPLFWLTALAAVVTARFFDLIILFTIVFIHELGHTFMAARFSWRIKHIFLLPFGGVAEFEEHGARPIKEEFLVTISGPVQHVWMLAVSYLLYDFSFISEKMFLLLWEYNWMILLFNFLPILPLDGGRMMYLLFCRISPYPIALKRTIFTSILFLFFYCTAILLIFPLHATGWVTAAFLCLSLYKEWKNRSFAFMRFLLDRYLRKPQLTERPMKIYVSKDDSLLSVLSKFYRGKGHLVIVRMTKGEEKKLFEEELLSAFFERNAFSLKMEDLLFHT